MSNSVLSDYKTPLLFSFILILGMFLGVKMADQLPKQKKSERQLDALINLIQTHYVDSLNTNLLYENGVEGILKSLDPHTVYIPKDELQISNEELEGSFYGIGTEFFMARDTVMISSVVTNGPASKAGIKTGDQFLKIDTAWVAGRKISQEDIVKKIRGQRATKVKVLVRHPDSKENWITITRDLVAYTSVTAAVKLTKETGYIAIRLFNETTYEEFKKALSDLKQQGISSLIIDVRNNPGGYMDAVANIADELISGKQLLISTKGKNEETKVYSEHPGMFETGTLSILINEYSASASEILAGITQDLDRGKVYGRRSYGKGLVQEQFELPDQSAIRITTARYYLPSGRCIQKNYADGKDEYHEDIYKRFHAGEMVHGDSSTQHKNHTLFYTKNKRTVYANEGISPDVFIAADTNQLNALSLFYGEHLPEQFAFPYLYSSKRDIANVQAYDRYLMENLAWWNDFQLFLQGRKIRIPATLEETIKHDVMAQMASVWYGKSGEIYFRAKSDAVIQEVLKQKGK